MEKEEGRDLDEQMKSLMKEAIKGKDEVRKEMDLENNQENLGIVGGEGGRDKLRSICNKKTSRSLASFFR